MLYGPPPEWTPQSFLAAIARLRLDRLQMNRPSPTILWAYGQILGFDELMDLLVGYRRLVVGRADDDVAADAIDDSERALALLARLEPMLDDAPLFADNAAMVLLVLRETVELIASCLAVGTTPPPLAWATFSAFEHGAAVIGASFDDPDLTPFDALRRGFVVDCEALMDGEVRELQGAQVVKSETFIDDLGEPQLRLVTARRGTWQIGVDAYHRLEATLWDFPTGRGAQPRARHDLGARGRIRTTSGIDEDERHGLRVTFDSGETLEVTRPVYRAGGTRIASQGAAVG